MKQIPASFYHQKKAFGFVRNLDQFALFADQGTGKSRMVIDKASFLFNEGKIDKVVIICLNFLKYQWLEEFEIHCPIFFAGFVYEGQIKGRNKLKIFDEFCKNKNLKIMCINIEAFQGESVNIFLKQFLDTTEKEAFIVIDESVTIKNPKAKRTKQIIKGFRKRKYKCILSGTPTPNSPADLYSQFNFLKENFFKCTHFQFKNRHILLVKEKSKMHNKPFFIPLRLDLFKQIKQKLSFYSALTPDIIFSLSALFNLSEKNILLINKMEENKFTAFKNMPELNEQISSITFKITKKECLDIPDKIYEKLDIELNAEQLRMIKELKNRFYTRYAGKEINVENVISVLLRYRMIVGGIFAYQEHFSIENYDDLMAGSMKTKTIRIKPNPKIIVLLQDLETVEQNTSVIIWACFIEELKYIYDELKEKYTCALYYGATDKEDRKEIIKKFKNKEIKILIANPQVAGMGLNLQVSTLHYFYSNGYRGDTRVQAEDRSHRAGQTNKVVYKDLIAINSIDERIYDCLKNKKNILEYFKNKDNHKNIFH